MKVIDFPGAAKLNKKLPRLKKEELPSSPQNQMITEEASFTCPICSNKTKMNFEGMIFRSLDFHCSKCGTRHKISNPAFGKSQSSVEKRYNK